MSILGGPGAGTRVSLPWNCDVRVRHSASDSQFHAATSELRSPSQKLFSLWEFAMSNRSRCAFEAFGALSTRNPPPPLQAPHWSPSPIFTPIWFSDMYDLKWNVLADGEAFFGLSALETFRLAIL